jgi:hypothetical protein
MKLFKYSLLLAIAFVLGGCNGDDKPKGAGDATIGFAQSTYTYKESAGLVKIPLKFDGEPVSYPITFSVSAALETVAGDNAEIKDVVHFTQTENLHYAGIVANEETGEKVPAYLEFEIKDNPDINESRFLNLTLTSVSGATVTAASTKVEIKDNDNNPYEKLWGNWIFEGVDTSDGAKYTFEVNISGGFTEEDVAKNADKVLVCWGFEGAKYGPLSAPRMPYQPIWYINYDADAESLSVQVGTQMADGYLNFGLGSNTSVKLASTLPGSTAYDYKTQVKGTWSEDLNTMTFEEGYGLRAMIEGADDGKLYYWASYKDIVMTRK